MINLSARSYQKELLDNNAITFADIKQNMKELNNINTFLGGHAITITGLKAILDKFTLNNKVTICEIGCGGGDNLKAIADWCLEKNMDARFIGIDVKEECIAFAKQQYPTLNSIWITSDYKKVILKNAQPDIIFSSLFCHHFTEEELVPMLQWMKLNAARGFFINDLQRHRLAYYSIKVITRLFSRSYLVKHDAPLSVARGLIKKEWQKIISSAGIGNYSIRWKWAFRYLIIYCHE